MEVFHLYHSPISPPLHRRTTKENCWSAPHSHGHNLSHKLVTCIRPQRTANCDHKHEGSTLLRTSMEYANLPESQIGLIGDANVLIYAVWSTSYSSESCLPPVALLICLSPPPSHRITAQLDVRDSSSSSLRTGLSGSSCACAKLSSIGFATHYGVSTTFATPISPTPPLFWSSFPSFLSVPGFGFGNRIHLVMDFNLPSYIRTWRQPRYFPVNRTPCIRLPRQRSSLSKMSRKRSKCRAVPATLVRLKISSLHSKRRRMYVMDRFPG